MMEMDPAASSKLDDLVKAALDELDWVGRRSPMEQMECSNQLEDMMINMIIKMAINQS